LTPRAEYRDDCILHRRLLLYGDIRPEAQISVRSGSDYGAGGKQHGRHSILGSHDGADGRKRGRKYETYLYRRSGEDDQLYKGDSFQYADRNRNGGFYNREGRRILSDQSGRLLYRK